MTIRELREALGFTDLPGAEGYPIGYWHRAARTGVCHRLTLWGNGLIRSECGLIRRHAAGATYGGPYSRGPMVEIESPNEAHPLCLTCATARRFEDWEEAWRSSGVFRR